jgi:hypothetical protein
MPTGEGWFIDATTGEAISVQEHETAVRANPDRFRIRPEETIGKDREQLLTLVCERGFVRVRWEKSVVFEFYGERDRALRLIRRFLLTQGVGLYTRIRINDLADDEFRVSGSWQELKHRFFGSP